MPAFLAGCVVSCGALLVLAGASKMYRGARRGSGDTAIWRALRVPRRHLWRADLAVGSLEGVTGTLVCTRLLPVVGGVAMACAGAAFCVLLSYVRVNQVPGGCGCVGWRRVASAASAGSAAETVTWRVIARAAMLSAAGIADALTSNGGAAVFHRASLYSVSLHSTSFYCGVLTGGAVLMLLSMHMPVRTPVCHRPLWRPARASLRVLAGHEVFAEMASAAGPDGPGVRYRRTGCTDEFWFPAAGAGAGAGGNGRAVVFRVSYPAPGGSPAVHATLRPGAELIPTVTGD